MRTMVHRVPARCVFVCGGKLLMTDGENKWLRQWRVREYRCYGSGGEIHYCSPAYRG
jgi:hypothetical protein